MTWITHNPELFILGVIVLLIGLIIFRSKHAKALSEPEKSDKPSEETPSLAEKKLPEMEGLDLQSSSAEPVIEASEKLEPEASLHENPPREEPISEPSEVFEPPSEEPIPPEPVVAAPVKKKNFFVAALQRSREALMGGLSALWSGEPLDEDALEELEDTLIAADLGAQVAMDIIEDLKEKAESGSDGSALREHLRSLLLERIGETLPLNEVEEGPLVILVVGVNGSGKTTTIGKLAHRYIQDGKRVMVAAGDTFRAGAIEQLKVWSERSGAEFISSQPKADPASVIYTALEAAKARNIDVVICDTAGRLQAQSSLMDELKKVARVGKKVIPGAPHEVLLVLDATIGQNALSQAEGFNEAATLTGVVLTKLDGTAKGGVVVAVKQKLGIPVKMVGLGEGIDDLRLFSPVDFVDALLLSESDEA